MSDETKCPFEVGQSEARVAELSEHLAKVLHRLDDARERAKAAEARVAELEAAPDREMVGRFLSLPAHRRHAVLKQAMPEVFVARDEALARVAELEAIESHFRVMVAVDESRKEKMWALEARVAELEAQRVALLARAATAEVRLGMYGVRPEVPLCHVAVILPREDVEAIRHIGYKFSDDSPDHVARERLAAQRFKEARRKALGGDGDE